MTKIRADHVRLYLLPEVEERMRHYTELAGGEVSGLGTVEEFYGSRLFTGHVREWTVSELALLSSWLGLEEARVAGRNWFLHSRYPRLPAPIRRMH